MIIIIIFEDASELFCSASHKFIWSLLFHFNLLFWISLAMILLIYVANSCFQCLLPLQIYYFSLATSIKLFVIYLFADIYITWLTWILIVVINEWIYNSYFIYFHHYFNHIRFVFNILYNLSICFLAFLRD
jgi:hypothetical protein